MNLFIAIECPENKIAPVWSMLTNAPQIQIQFVCYMSFFFHQSDSEWFGHCAVKFGCYSAAMLLLHERFDNCVHFKCQYWPIEFTSLRSCALTTSSMSRYRLDYFTCKLLFCLFWTLFHLFRSIDANAFIFWINSHDSLDHRQT